MKSQFISGKREGPERTPQWIRSVYIDDNTCSLAHYAPYAGDKNDRHGRYEDVYNTWTNLKDMSVKVSLEI